jgi:serine/threonine protein kinase
MQSNLITFHLFLKATQLFLVMEYAHGGDLYRLRERHGCLTEEHARFYFG